MRNCSGCNSCGNVVAENEISNNLNNHFSIVLVGNSKVGKSTLFSQLCPKKSEDMYVKFLNRKIEVGTTIHSQTRIINTPGLLSLFSQNLEERVARDILIPGAIPEKTGRIIIVADAKNLKRSISVAA